MEITLYASLQKWKPTQTFIHEVSGKRTVREVLQETGVPERSVVIVMINKRQGSLDSPVSNEDKLDLFPLFGGG